MATGTSQLDEDLKLVLEMEQNIDAEMKKASAATDEYIKKNQDLLRFYNEIIAAAKARGDTETRLIEVQNIHLAQARINLGEQIKLEQAEAEAKKQQAEAAKALEEAERRLQSEKRGLAQNMFAVTIMGFGLVSMFRQLEAVTGEKIPANIKSIADAVVVVASAASSGAMFGPAGAIIAGGAAGLMELLIGLQAVDPEIQKLNDTLDNLARKEEVANTLALIHGWTVENARSSLELARSDEQMALALKEVTLATEQYIQAEQRRQNLATAQFAGVGGMDSYLQPGPFRPTDTSRKDAAEENYRVQQLRAAYEAAQRESLKYYSQLSSAQEKVTEGNRRLEEDLKDLNDRRVTNMDKYIESMTSAWDSYQERVIAINQSLSNQLERIEDQRTEVSRRARADELDAWRQYQRALEREAQQLQTALDKIDREQTDRLTDLTWQYNRDVASANEQRAKNERDLAYEIYRIQRGMYQDLAELDFNYREDLYNANTRRERNSLERRHIFESNRIRQEASDSLEDLLKRSQDEEDASMRRRRLMEEEYRHKREIILRDTQQQRDDAQEAYDNAKVLAEQRRDDQLQDIAEREQAEKAALDRQTEYARTAASQQLQAAKENYSDQITAARKRFEEERDEIAKTQKAVEDAWEKRRLQLEQEIYFLRVMVDLIYRIRGIPTPPDLWNPVQGPEWDKNYKPPRIDEIERERTRNMLPVPQGGGGGSRTDNSHKVMTMNNYGLSPREVRQELRNFFIEEGDI